MRPFQGRGIVLSISINIESLQDSGGFDNEIN